METFDKKKKTDLPPIPSLFQYSQSSLPSIANYGSGFIGSQNLEVMSRRGLFIVDFDIHASANLPRPYTILSRLITCFEDISFDYSQIVPNLALLASSALQFHYSTVDACSD
ncbi:MAG: hypothetical protein EZS28_052552 [Streblomastix strix]|uniref:Uncharacterized protein n=1 Tax=Streblomastix strix TaxID=222440 RepID=A0A5J4S4L9_9EUKA|nr:MAG: hypothetical protein EZS28_052552 [Streblomastix strix]